MEDYLKAIYSLQVDGHPVTNQQLADALGYSGASITNMQKKLHELHLLVLEPYKGVRLTPAGTAVALEVIRHHRLLELYLARTLGMDLDSVHAEADKLEHYVSEELEARIAAALGHPEFDPHGDPIPSPDLEIPIIDDVSLEDVAARAPAIVTRVSDRNPETVRALVASGVLPGIEMLEITNHRDHGGLVVTLSDGQTVALSADQAAAIRVRCLTSD